LIYSNVRQLHVVVFVRRFWWFRRSAHASYLTQAGRSIRQRTYSSRILL